MNAEKLIDRLGHQAALEFAERVRARRKHAFPLNPRCRVVLTKDGCNTREEMFDHLPTIGRLEAHVGRYE